MKYKILLSTLMVLAFSLAACAPATDTPTPIVDTPVEMATDTPAVMVDTPTAEVMPTDEMAATETPSGGEIPNTGNAPLSVSKDASMNAYLVDANGMAVYAFAKDTQNGTTSACTDACATNWKPVTASGETSGSMPGAGTPTTDASMLGTPTADASMVGTPTTDASMVGTPTTDASMGGTPQADMVDMSKVGSITLPDGTVQLTYNGWLLYHYVQDMAPGDTKGAGMDSNWFLVSPSGDVVKTSG